MSVAIPWSGSEVGGPIGHSYGAVLVRSADASSARVLDALAEIRFSGWVAEPEAGWIVAIAQVGGGTAARSRLGVIGAAARVALWLEATAFAVRVLVDRQLVLAAWTGDEELGRYASDPSREPGADEEVRSVPFGAEFAGAFAAASARPEVAEDLEEALAEELDPESVSESERLLRVLRLLGMPAWIVASESLPRDIPTGPRARELVRLGAGRAGVPGRLLGRAVEVVRKRRLPPPAIADPPRSSGPAYDPWLF